MREFYEYDDPNGELMRRLERDEEKEPCPRFVARPRRKQFRYWAGSMFRPERPQAPVSTPFPEVFS